MEVVRFGLSASGLTPLDGLNITATELESQEEQGPINLAIFGLEAVGGVCTDYSGNIYVSDPEMHVIIKIDQGGRVSTVAGKAGVPGRNGTLTVKSTFNNPVARFNTPRGLCCDKSGNVYVADSGNNQIRVIRPDGTVSHIAGNGNGTAGNVNNTTAGDGGEAMFNNPVDVAINNTGVIYVCDKGNHAIKQIKGGNVLTVAGNGTAGDQAGVQVFGGVSSCLNNPNSIAIDPEGNIMICDTDNYKIKKLTPSGYLYRHSGSGTKGKGMGTSGDATTANSKAYTCQYVDLRYSAVDKSGNMYVVDRGDSTYASRIIKVDYNGTPGVIAEFTGNTTYNNTSLGIAVSPGQKLFVTFASESELGSSSSSVDSSSSSSSSSS